MSRPRLADLFCGAGGATRGYQRAGFEVWGVDNRPQPRYCGDHFTQADVFALEPWFLAAFDAIHASPPCQAYTLARNNGSCDGALDLVGATRDLLHDTGLPFVIENVEGSPLIAPATICGASLGLRLAGFDLRRHRLFETNWSLMTPPCSHRRGQTMGVYGNGTNSWHRALLGRDLTAAEVREGMEMSWATRLECAQAVPPAYTELIGAQLLQHVRCRSAA